jgi:hypothetical protein
VTADYEPYEPPGLRDLVSRLAYKPGWLMYLSVDHDEDGSGGLTFFVVSDTADSYQPDQRIRVRHGFLVPRASYNERTWMAWLFDRVRDVEAHEAGEFFKVDGVRVFAPHHGNGEDPYRLWHVGDFADTRVRAGNSKPAS